MILITDREICANNPTHHVSDRKLSPFFFSWHSFIFPWYLFMTINYQSLDPSRCCRASDLDSTLTNSLGPFRLVCGLRGTRSHPWRPVDVTMQLIQVTLIQDLLHFPTNPQSPRANDGPSKKGGGAKLQFSHPKAPCDWTLISLFSFVFILGLPNSKHFFITCMVIVGLRKKTISNIISNVSKILVW